MRELHAEEQDLSIVKAKEPVESGDRFVVNKAQPTKEYVRTVKRIGE